jgi:AbrB family looped-hinge helix DNA binding protein
MSITAKITKKGQVTIPKKIRKRLNSQVIEFDIVDNNVLMRPVKSVAGSLTSYSRKRAPSFKEERERAWEKAIEDRYGKKADRR